MWSGNLNHHPSQNKLGLAVLSMALGLTSSSPFLTCTFLHSTVHFHLCREMSLSFNPKEIHNHTPGVYEETAGCLRKCQDVFLLRLTSGDRQFPLHLDYAHEDLCSPLSPPASLLLLLLLHFPLPFQHLCRCGPV